MHYLLNTEIMMHVELIKWLKFCSNYSQKLNFWTSPNKE